MKLSYNALLLLKLNLLNNARRGAMGRIVGNRKVTVRSAILFRLVAALVWIGFSCVVPLFALSDLGETTEIGQGFVQYHHLVLNGTILAMFYLGLFLGANLIFDIATGENEQLLSCPIVIEDLVHYRVVETSLGILTFCIYVICPFLTIQFVALGWSTLWIIANVLLMALLSFGSCVLGILALLSIAKRLPRHRSDGICITIFLISGWLFVVAVRMYKEGLIGSGDESIWLWLNQQLSFVSLSPLRDSMVQQSWGLRLYLLMLAAGSAITVILVVAFKRACSGAFHRIHMLSDEMAAQLSRSVARLGFRSLDRRLRFLSLETRSLLVKDILSLIRRPRMLVSTLAFIVFLAIAANWDTELMADPTLIVLYFSSTYIVLRLFINTIGQERNNILLIKQLFPFVSSYLSVRVKIATGVSLIAIIPLWAILSIVLPNLSLLEVVLRLPLLLSNVILSSLLTIWYSAAFAEFADDRPMRDGSGIHPAAHVGSWVMGAISSLFYYSIDLHILKRTVGDSMMTPILLMAAIIAGGAVVARRLGIRRVRRYI